MNDSIESVAEMNHAMEKDFKVISLLKNKITKKDLLLEDHMMSLHNAEQEIIRMQSLVDCVSVIDTNDCVLVHLS